MTAYQQIVSMLKQAGIIETDSLTENQLHKFSQALTGCIVNNVPKLGDIK